MAARPTRTDYEVALLINAALLVDTKGYPGQATLDAVAAPFEKDFHQRRCGFSIHAHCAPSVREPHRRRLKETVRALDLAYRRRLKSA